MTTKRKPRTLRRPQDLTSADRAAIIRQLEFGFSLSDQTAADFADSSTMMDVRRRRFVYRAGDRADALYAIVQRSHQALPHRAAHRPRSGN